jgi:hypothetical protein
MTPEEHDKFVQGYTQVLTNTWSDESYENRLLDNPREVLAESGLTVPSNAIIQIIRNIAGEGTLEDQVKLWEAGPTTGTYELYVPHTTQTAQVDLSETDLEAVAGGGDACCCCCPCCTCT